MAVLKIFLLMVEVITCLLLIGVVLLQKSKSQGAGLALGAGMGESLFGAQAGNVLTKATVILAVIFLLNTTILALLGSSGGKKTGSVMDGAVTTPPPSSQPVQQPGQVPPGSGGVVQPILPDVGSEVQPIEIPAGDADAEPVLGPETEDKTAE
ncbi:preprotein translocase subunit SecG [Verrucomicrobiota bacterium]